MPRMQSEAKNRKNGSDNVEIVATTNRSSGPSPTTAVSNEINPITNECCSKSSVKEEAKTSKSVLLLTIPQKLITNTVCRI